MVDGAQVVLGWQQAVDTVHQQLQDTANTVGNGVADVVNGIASYGSAVLDHPGDALAMVGGAALAVLGAGGEIGGAALDATGIGAALGVPVGVVSAGAIGGGLATAAAGAAGLAQAATGADQVQPMQANIFGRAKPGDADLEDQRKFADASQRARDYVESTGKLPPKSQIPPVTRNSRDWEKFKDKNGL